ncbi:hypothetical protein KO02_13080 [Sphingobacterium sp. ML3W]|uniref:hypothetical protein n=1 Tax=Sphingobacterium sp. ML3W TaxID=1538644 RepID=UPI0004F6CF98|nr:hypothetical protein [Sphingobacterium sp. ML3W]AIM37520.1 hypothetical protein KO02_13080 [Sphingobacterium sp. ML3W]
MSNIQNIIIQHLINDSNSLRNFKFTHKNSQADQDEGYQKTTYSANYNKLPEVIKTQVAQFWEKLDKD